MSGHVTALGRSLGSLSISVFWRSLLVISSFCLGCTLATAFFPNQILKLQRRYAFLWMLTAVFLIVALTVDVVSDDDVIFLLFCACAMGYQNSFGTQAINSFEHRPVGFSFRTTHMTGLLTDLGIIMGRMVFHRDVTKSWVFTIYLSMLLGYIAGGILSYPIFLSFGKKGIGFNVVLICFSGLVYIGVVMKVARERVALLGLIVNAAADLAEQQGRKRGDSAMLRDANYEPDGAAKKNNESTQLFEGGDGE